MFGKETREMPDRDGFKLGTVFLLCSFLLHGTAVAVEGANLIRNGDFEKGLEGWGKPTVELIEGEKAAHSGTKCVAGTVEKMRRSRVIAQELELDASRVYRVSFWTKSPQRARSIVHLLYGKKGRMEILEIRRGHRRWRRHEVLFSPRMSGKQTLRFAIPSAFGSTGKPGQVFLDDVELTALPQAKAPMNITKNDGFSDWPGMAADGKGNLWAAWISYVNPGEDRARTEQVEVALQAADLI
jgi:hypothetical protein